MDDDWVFNELDRNISDELQDFLPEQIFDCHAHLWQLTDSEGPLPDIFANGGDQTEANPTEHAVCEELSIKELFNVGGAKIASSGDLVRKVSLMHQNRKIKRVSFS